MAGQKGIAMFHVHIVCEPYGPTPHTATFVRSLLPLTHPVNASAISVTHSSEYRKADALLVERAWASHREAAQFLVARARIDRTPVIYTTDDNLVDLDPSLTRGYLTPAHITAAEYLAREASGIIVSTEPLRSRMAKYNSQVVVVENAIDERLFATAPSRPRRNPGKIVIGYMGTATHDADFKIIIEALRAIFEEFGETVSLEIIGGVANALTLAPLEGRPVRVVHAGDSMSYPAFMRRLAENNTWDLAVAPLCDTPFNRCKSDLKFLDYGAMSVPAVFSAISPYRASVVDGQTGLLAENTTNAWRNALRRLIVDADLRFALGRGARSYVFERRTLRKAASLWVQAIQSLLPPASSTTSCTRIASPVRASARGQPTPNLTVVVPGKVNYFYNRAGQRIAGAIHSLGASAEIHTLESLGRREGGCILVVSPPEVVASCADKSDGLSRIRALVDRADLVVAVSLECARTHWFTDQAAICNYAGIETIIDLGVTNQYEALTLDERRQYHFVVNGLTAAERQ